MSLIPSMIPTTIPSGRSLGRAAASCALAFLLTVPALAQQANQQPNWVHPETPWGDPDIQGLWPGEISVPLQRDPSFGTRATLTEAEYAERQAAVARERDAEQAPIAAAGEGSRIGPPTNWGEYQRASMQTSAIVDPANGRLPALTPLGKQMLDAAPAAWEGYADEPSDLSLYYRCVTRGVIGSMLSTLYDNGNRILQSPGYVVIQQEMIHEARVIPLDGRPHPNGSIKMFMGDSRGHFEGNTLVIETTNFTDKTAIGGNGRAIGGNGGPNSESLTLVERFTRTSQDTMVYEATIIDPIVWERPWTLRLPFERNQDYGFYEYACHEGNYAMEGILTGMRAEEAGLATGSLR